MQRRGKSNRFSDALKREAPWLKGLCAQGGEVRPSSIGVKRPAGMRPLPRIQVTNRSGTA